MTGPFSPSSTIAPPSTATPVGTVAGDGFWPDVDLDALRKGIRVDQTVTPERLRDVACSAILDIMVELADWRAEQRTLGHDRLEDVPGRHQVDGRSDYQIRWVQAVQAVVAADLGDRHLGQAARSAGVDRAEEFAIDVDLHRSNVTWAVRAFLGLPRIIAEVI